MKRPLWLGLGLILASNAVALAGVWYNRSGEPLAQLQLSERELNVATDALLNGQENSVLRLRLSWRHAGEGSSLPWLDTAKLRELGFAPEQLDQRGERPVWVVLELDGPAYRQRVASAQAALAGAAEALLQRPDDEALQRQHDESKRNLDYESRVASRLLLVDAGLDPEALRQAWPDRQRQVILASRFSPYLQGHQAGYGASVRLEADRISIPGPYRETLAQWRQYRYEEKRPRAQVEVAFGQRHEPWLISVDQ